MWFMLTGEQPFPGMHPKKMGETLAAGIRPPMPQNAPAPLAKLISACWNTDPNARPPLDTLARILSVSEAKLFAGYSISSMFLFFCSCSLMAYSHFRAFP